jgi:hypothetical protein
VTALLKRENVEVNTENDVVVLKVGRHVARFAYGTAFVIAQRLRLSANVALRHAGVARDERAELKREQVEDEFDYFADCKLDTDGALSEGFRWEVGNEGELVVFQISDLIIRWEAPAAMTIAAWFREAGQRAKAWAGDVSTTRRLLGILSDANESARLIK